MYSPQLAEYLLRHHFVKWPLWLECLHDRETKSNYDAEQTIRVAKSLTYQQRNGRRTLIEYVRQRVKTLHGEARLLLQEDVVNNLDQIRAKSAAARGILRDAPVHKVR